MMNIKRLLILGGDKRQEYMALDLYKKGLEVYVCALSDFDSKGQIKSLNKDELEGKLHLFDAVILPLPVSRDNKNINTRNEEISLDFLLDRISPNQVAFAGMMSEEYKSKFFKKGVKLYDYFERDDLKIKNSFPTAQGILKIILENLPICLNRMNCMVTGCGKTAQSISLMLKKLGVNVTVAARKCSDIAWAQNNSMNGIYIKNLGKNKLNFDAVINTVPSLILNDNVLSKLNKDCLLIEVASKPYGIDFDSAQKHKLNYIIAGSLPGKTAPKTAGEIISDTIFYMIREGR